MSSADVKANLKLCKSQLTTWSIVATTDGKVDGPGYGGKVHTGSSGMNEAICGQKFIMKVVGQPEKQKIHDEPPPAKSIQIDLSKKKVQTDR